MSDDNPHAAVLRAYLDEVQVPLAVLNAAERVLALARERAAPPTSDIELARALRRIDELSATVGERDAQLVEGLRRRDAVLAMLASELPNDPRWARVRELAAELLNCPLPERAS